MTGRRWPGTFRAEGVVASGRLDGELGFARRSGEWTLSGHAALLDLDASGPLLAGDRPRLDRIAGDWKVAGSGRTWTIHRLDLRSSLATLKAEGEFPASPGSSARIAGEIDLAASARLLPHTLRIRDGVSLDRGSAKMRIESRKEAARNVWDVQADVSDLVAHRDGRAFTLRQPATLAARVLEAGGALTVERFAAESAFGKVSGQGDLDRGVNWTATLDLEERPATASRPRRFRHGRAVGKRPGVGRPPPDRGGPGRDDRGGVARLDSLPAGDDPAFRLDLKASYHDEADRLDLAEMALVEPLCQPRCVREPERPDGPSPRGPEGHVDAPLGGHHRARGQGDRPGRPAFGRLAPVHGPCRARRRLGR